MSGDTEITAEHARLRAFALGILARKSGWDDDAHSAISALGGGPIKNAWVYYTDQKAEEGQWFYWRHPHQPDDIHVDQALLDGDGRIAGKYGCGLTFYPWCQPCRFDTEVAAAVLAYQNRHTDG